MIQARIIGIDALWHLNEVLKLYVKARIHRDQAEILQQKGTDLLIQLYRGYRERRWRGGRRIGWKELAQRAKKGKGTKVRLKTLEGNYAAKAPKKTKRGHPLTFWQKLIFQEVSRREKGIGVLAVGFLPRRWRYTKKGRYLSKNQTNRPKEWGLENMQSRQMGTLTQVTWGPGFFRVVGSTPGSRVVSFRYGIENRAMDRVGRDMIQYVERTMKDGLKDHLRNAGF